MLTVIVIVAIVALVLYLMRDRLPQLRRWHPSNREGVRHPWQGESSDEHKSPSPPRVVHDLPSIHRSPHRGRRGKPA